MKYKKSFAAGFLLFATSMLSAQDRISLPPQLVGPMVGHVTPAEAILWMVANDDSEVIVRYRATSDSPDRQQAIRPQADADAHGVIKGRLTGLKPSTRYEYEVVVGGQTNRVWNGGFSTPPPDGRGSRFRMAVSSCMSYQSDPIQPSWYLLLAEKPQLQLLLGDNVYADTTDRQRLWEMHVAQRRVVEFAAVLRNVPTYAMWDDHDYGPNNSDGTEPGKQESLASFRELFANPAAGTDDVPGAFYRFHWGDVEFFVLDGRYHRSPDVAPNDDRKRMLGDEQFQWLADGLRASKAKFKVLASGSTLQASTNDGWRIYDFARNRLYRTIRDDKISGVIYLSGDVHSCQLDVHPASETGGYPLYEVISSGIASSVTDGFAILEFDTTQRDPTIRIRIVHGDATTPVDRTIKLSELQVP